MRRTVVAVCSVIALVGGVGYGSQAFSRAQPAPAAKATVAKLQPLEVTNSSKFDMSMHSTDAADSLWTVVNKRRPLLPTSYIPVPLVVPSIPLRSNITADERQTRQETATALQSLHSTAQSEGIQLELLSGYRSYTFQQNLYNRYVSLEGQAAADLESARAGHSEHQTGLAVDLGGSTRPECNLEKCFADTPEGQWLASNAHRFGFIIRYPENKTDITGYTFEPWHLRFVGPELADVMQREKVKTLEEFFKLPAAANYN